MLSFTILTVLLMLSAFLAGCIVGCWLGRRRLERLGAQHGSLEKGKSAKASAKRASKRRSGTKPK